MKKIALILLVSSTCLTSCMRRVIIGSGNQVTQARSTAAFDAVDISGAINTTINIQDGATPSVQIAGYQNIVSYIKTDVKDHTLHIYTAEDADLNTNPKATAIITIPNITSLSLSGASDADIHGNMKGDSFRLEVSGASDVHADNISVSNFSTEISGAAKVKINGGNTHSANYQLSGAAKLNAFNLVTDETTVDLSGAGVADVNAQKKLDASVSGAGAIHYKGHPVVTSQTSGIGAVSDAN